MKKFFAFSLIELMIVILIIAILSALLFPVFSQAKESAKKTVCLSNTKQMALGLYMYATDNDDTLCQTSWEQDPANFMGGLCYNPQNPNGTMQVHWTYLIQPYIHNLGIFVCPSDPLPIGSDHPCPRGNADVGQLDGAGQMYCDWEAQKNSYVSVYNLLPAHDWAAYPMSAINNPSSQIAVGEHRNDLTQSDDHKGTSGFMPSQPCPQWTIVPLWPGGKQYSYFTEAVADTEYQKAIADGFQAAAPLFKDYDILRVAWDRHSGGNVANYSFADGHARSQTLGATLNPSAYEYGDRWYPGVPPWNAGHCP